MDLENNLAGKVVLLTGACGDIGRATARAFAARGAYLALNDLRTDDEATGLVEELSRLGGEAIFIGGDISQPGVVTALVESALGRFQHVDICIGNAGIVKPCAFLETSQEDWARQLAVNLTSSFLIGQAAARAMIQGNSQGRIIFVSSWVQDIPSANLAPYCVSKSGIKMLAKCMALELGRFKITVNLVAPGFVDAGLSGRMFEQRPQLRENALQMVPLGYIMSAADVAAAVLLLCSPGAEYMTGATFLVDGGNSLAFRHDTP